MRRVRLLTAGVVAAAALALGACGSDDDSSSSSADTAEESGAAEDSGGERVVIEAEEGAFDPAAVYERAAPGVVTVIATLPGDGQSITGEPSGEQQGQGSGFVISENGEIVTNAHVVTDGEASGAGGDISEAREVFVAFPDRNQVPAEIVGFDPFADVALLKVDPEGLDLQPLELGDDQDLKVGESVAAIGSPFGEDQSLSVGVISATDRSIVSLTDFQIDGALQTDASINPGNSGGPLLDSEGRVIGLNQQIDTTSGGNQGVGFAVPISLAERSIDQLREDGETEYAYIGVTTQPLYPQLADRLDVDADTGALIAEVVENGPGDDAGIRGGDSTISFQGSEVEVGGDVITAVDGEPIVDVADLPRIISRLDPGQDVEVDLIRDGETQTLTVTLGTRPDSVEAPG